jgi:endonuclease/exonuclease/phosphatase family metal-dependent hydrolase
MSYNVHGCVGADLRLVPARITALIAESGADVVALQELDVERARSGRSDQPRWLAERLGMQLAFCSARECDSGRYGNAVLSHYPLEVMRSACLPQRVQRHEQRAVQWVRVHAPGLALNLINTHLGLDGRERLLHVATILGREWVHQARALGPTVLCGDFNSGPRSAVYRQLTRELGDAQRLAPGHEPRRTFPSLVPLMRIDHLLVSPDLRVRACRVAAGLRARIASDHLPLIAELELERGQRDEHEP